MTASGKIDFCSHSEGLQQTRLLGGLSAFGFVAVVDNKLEKSVPKSDMTHFTEDNEDRKEKKYNCKGALIIFFALSITHPSEEDDGHITSLFFLSSRIVIR